VTEIDIPALVRGINARRANVSVISPSSAAASPVTSVTDEGAFQSDAFQEDAFQT
jgi:hypothetical protein